MTILKGHWKNLGLGDNFRDTITYNRLTFIQTKIIAPDECSSLSGSWRIELCGVHVSTVSGRITCDGSDKCSAGGEEVPNIPLESLQGKVQSHSH